MKTAWTILFALLAIACESNENPPDCSTVLCTAEFRVISVSVSDPSGTTIPLDSYQVIELPGGNDVTPAYSAEDLETYREFNEYPILTDARGAELRNERVVLEFRGFTNETRVASRTFLVGADCCHVAVFEGDTDIVVE